tara:strand:+ start:2535 stop:4352 length:1818 start_codon:yes stop_codon:yes gene_type:complete
MSINFKRTLALVALILVFGQLLSCAAGPGAEVDRNLQGMEKIFGKTPPLNGLVSTQRSSVMPSDEVRNPNEVNAKEAEPLKPMEMVLMQSDLIPRVRKTKSGPLFTILAQDLDVKTILFSLSREIDQNILIDPLVAGIVSVDLKDVTLREALSAILKPLKMRYAFKENFIKIEAEQMETRIFHLNYIVSSRQGTSKFQSSGASQISELGILGSLEGTGNVSKASSLVSRENTDLWKEITVGIQSIINSSSVSDGRRTSIISGDKSLSTSNSQANLLEGSSPTAQTTITRPRQASTKQKLFSSFGGYVSINRQSGVIIVRNYPEILMKVADYLEAVEGSSQRQVFIQAKILEVILNEDYSLGIDWSAISPITLTHESPAGIADGVPLRESMGLTYGLSNASLRAVTNALTEQGQVNILSSPKIVTLNNQRAVIKVGTEDVYFIPQAPVATTAKAPTTIFQPATVTVGIVLDVVPQINANGTVMMSINASISERSGVAASPDGVNHIPILNVRESNNVMLAQNGQTIIIGGLMQKRATKEIDKLPFFSAIPVLGKLFERESKNISKAELVIMLTPKVLVGKKIDDQLRAETRNFRKLEIDSQTNYFK